MAIFLIACGVLLICWGGIVLATGDFIATLDIAAGLVSSGVVVIALAAIVRVLDQLRRVVPARWDQTPRVDLPELVKTEAASAPPEAPVRITPVVERVPAPAPKAEAEPAVRAPVRTPKAENAPEVPPVAVADVEEERIATPAPAAASAAQPEEQAPPRSLIREGVIDGRTYRFYTDGSIEADGPDGIRRYASMAEAREQILRARSVQPEARREAPDGDAGEAAASAAVRPGIRQEPAAPAKTGEVEVPEPQSEIRPVSWDGYLAAGRGTSNASGNQPASDPEGDVPAERPEGRSTSSAPRVTITPDVRSQPRPASLEQNWSESFRQLLKKGSTPQPSDDADPTKT